MTRLDKAQELFEQGDVDRAGRALFDEHKHALKRKDHATIEAVDSLVTKMRGYLSGDELARFDSLVATRESKMGEEVPQRTGTRGPALWITLGALALMVIGAFGPWLKALGVAVNGTDGSNDGWIVVGAAVVAALLVWGYTVNGSRGLCVLIGLAGALGLVVSIHDRHRVEHATATASSLIQVGWGLNLDLVASAALIVMALILLSGSRVIVLGEPALPTRGAARNPDSSRGNADRLEQLKQLHDSGLITAEELATKRAAILDQI